MKRLLILLILIFISTTTLVYGQGENLDVEMADALRQNGKIYVVVTVVSIIFTGLFVYLLVLDNKLKKLEKEIKSRP